MATKEVTFQNYNAETGEYFSDTKTCTVVDSSYNEGTLGGRDGEEHWYVVDSSINLGWFNVRGDVHLILSDGCTLTADKKYTYYSAVNVEEEDSFTIYGQTAGTGKLVAMGGYKSAGIGGDNKEDNGAITINGGVVEAYGGDYGAGIGGGHKGYGKNITINGGTVKAYAVYSAAGIGGGYDGQGHDITINGGVVTAEGDWSAGIGGGFNSTGYNITITGGVVNASASNYGAGIGGGDYKAGYNITISGGTVDASGGYWAAGIGGGAYGEGHNITITGGIVNATGSYAGAGIGGGYSGSGYDITITDGEVNAICDKRGTSWGATGAGIGGGDYGDGYNITITGGTVNAVSGHESAGIGGGDNGHGYDITISGGIVTAEGGHGAGIGGGDGGEGYDITINGGIVNANASGYGAGIGGGKGHDITINGGTVIATGGSGAGIGSGAANSDVVENITINDGTVIAISNAKAGIGGGKESKNITINGGTVIATGGGDGGAGIGGGCDKTGKDITINGGTVIATGDNDGGAGIGGGYGGEGVNITVNGGEVIATGGSDGGAGIGGGKKDAGEDININGGLVIATGGAEGAGIGGGKKAKEASVTIDGGTVLAAGGDGDDASGIGSKESDVKVKQEISVEAGNSYPLDSIEHTDGENIGGKLENKRYAETVLSNTALNTATAVTESVTYTRSGGVVGNGGYYNITATGSLTNTSYIITFDCTSTTGNGGAIYSESTIDLANATFSNCYTANGNGGAICNVGGTISLTDAVFDSNTSVHGGCSASGGAVYMNGGFLSATGSGVTSVFKNNGSWDTGGAIVMGGSAAGTLDNVSFEGNYSRNGGAVSLNDGTLTVSNATFKLNAAKIIGINGGLGGAFLVTANGTLNLDNVTFDGNTATSGGAIYAEAGGKVNLTGKVYLATSTDTIVNNGTLNWNLTGASGSTGYLDDYSLLSNAGNLVITVNSNEKFTATYLLASNAANAAGESFTITGVSGEADKSITVGGDTVTYNDVKYTLAVNADNELVLDAQYTAERIVVSGEFTLADAEVDKLSNPALDGGAFLVENTGKLTVIDSTFTTNTGKNGGAIYNGGTTTLSNVTFNGNTAIDSASGALYNAGTLTLNSTVTLATDSDRIYNAGALVWNITTTDCGYLSDWSKLTNSGTFTIAGTKDNKCGQYVLAGNAAAAAGAVFTITVGDNEKTITVNGDAIAFNGTYYGRLSVDSDDDLILTVAANRIVVKDGETFSIQDGMVLNGQQSVVTSGDGGVFEVQAGGVLTNDGTAVIRGFSASGNGGAIVNSGTVSLGNVAFANNQSDYYGGAIYSIGGGESEDAVLELDHTVFSGNIAGENGGAINFYRSSATITNSVFEQNSSGFHGGAIYVQNSDVTLKNVEFNGNHASRGGGGINVWGDNVYLDDVLFNGNRADDFPEGGAIRYSAANLYLVGNVILATETDTIYGYDGSIIWQLDHGKNGYISNYALVTTDPDYQATYIVDADNADVNTAYILAGNASSADQQTFTLSGGTITVNGDSVGKEGKYYTFYTDGNDDLRFSVTERLVVDGGTVALADGLVFTNNGTPYSGDGGSVEVKNGGILIVQDSGNTPVVFRNSAASGNGGAICNSGTISLGGATFSGNTASGGGAIYNTGTISFAGAVTLATDSDTWFNAGNDTTTLATVNWDLSGTTTACINGFDYFSNGDNTRQTITVSANQAFGSYVIATGKISGASGKNVFTLTGVEGKADVTIAIYDKSVVYNDQKYSLYVDDGGTPEVLTDDALVLTIASMAVAEKVTVTSETGPESNPYDLGSGETYTVPTVSDSGGAVGVRTDAYATGEALTFSGNTAHFGGAVYVEYGHLTFSDDGTDAGILFYNNASTSKGSGGALYTIGSETKRSTITFQDDVEFTQNMVSDGYNGGALCSTYSDIVFEKSATFTDNGVRPFAEDAFGGALYNGSTATITFRDDVVFSGNLASGITGDLCGAVYNSATITFAKAMTLATETDTFYNNGGALIWDISDGTDSYAHLNQYNRLNNASDNGELVFMTSGTQELGDYVVASNVETLSRANSSFIVRGRANDARGLAFTFGSSPVFYNGRAYTLRHNATDHTLVLTTAERPAAGTYKFMVDSAMGASAEAAYNLNQDADASGTISHITGIREGAVMISEGAFSTATNLTVSQNTVTCGNFLEACGAGLTNYGGNVAFYGAGSGESNQTRFSGNTVSASDGGSSVAKGGAIFTIGGTFAFHNAAVFSDNVVTGINVTGAAIYNEKGTFVFHDNVSFDGNTASAGNLAQGGAINNVNGSVIFESDVVFSNNAAMAASAYGGAIMNTEGSIQFLGNVTFTNNAASSVAGAIVNADKMTFAKTMTLTGGTVANADTIYNMGVLNWDISQGDPATAGSYAVLNGFEKLFNDEGSLTITVSASQADGRYVIATGDLTDVEGKNSFTLTGVAGEIDVAVTIGGDKVTYNELDYTLAIENDALVLTAALHGYALTSASNIPEGGVNFSVGGKTVTRADENESVTLDAISVDGYTFLGFSSDDVTITGNVFTMPGNDVTIQANYEVTVNPGAFYSSTWTSGQSIDVTWHNTQYSGTVGDGTFFNNYADAKTKVASTSNPIVILESSTITSVQHYDAQNIYISGADAVYNRMILGGELISGSHSYTGDYTVNIDSGTFVREVAGGDASNKYVDRTGNITLNISGGVFGGHVIGGGYYSNNALGIYQMTGDVYFSISGGVFQQRVYGGCASFTEETSALAAMEGDIYLTIDASIQSITFNECIAAGNRGKGLLVGSTNVTVTGKGSKLIFADASVLFGGCSGDYYENTGAGRVANTSVVDPKTWEDPGVRALTFSNFTGDFGAEIRMFSDITFIDGTLMNFTDAKLDLKEVGNWNFDCTSFASNLNKNQFAGDTINVDTTALTEGSWTLLSGDAAAFADLGSAQSVSFSGSTATWSGSAWSDGIYTLALDDQETSLIVSKIG